jgi:NAD(P)-dependent dehydrogenase (short-subunit alcohol dehydrogenase family)
MAAEGQGGSIVLISSVSGLRGAKGRVAYGASKAAVINMAQVMAIDLAHHGIRANAICPGPIETPMVARLHDPATRENWLSRIPAARYGRVEEVAEAALFLLDPARSGYINGHALAVDGGFAGAGLLA